jgi:hypothetical protein
MAAANDDESLTAAAGDFADELTGTARGALGPDVPKFQAVVRRKGVRRSQHIRVLVAPASSEGAVDVSPIPLKIGEHVRLELKVTYLCTWDRERRFLAVDDSHIQVRMARVPEPLFRMEFLRNPKSTHVPQAHIQVHAHRDELTYLLMAGGDSQRARRRASKASGAEPRIPRLQELHFPLGGPRFRPCLEDVLEMLIDEFGVDATPDAHRFITEGRVRWRRLQTATVTRECPAEAARALRDLGYEVTPPSSIPPESSGRLSAF